MRAFKFAILACCLAGPVRATLQWTNVGGLGTADFSIDPGSVGDYTQTASQLTFNRFTLGDSIYGGYTASNWSAYSSFGIRINLATNPNQPFNFFVYDNTYSGGATGVNTYAGSSELLEGDVIVLTLLSGTANLANIAGIGFGLNGDSTTDLVATHVVASPRPTPPPSTGGSFTARAPGGVRFYSSTNNTAGVQLVAGASAWASLSDSNAKTAVTAVDHREVLHQVSELPITAWQYQHDPNRRYVGPMAQDFHGTFGLGQDDKHISTLDTDGVALSALKGLIAELQERQVRSAAQAKRLQELQRELEELQQAVEALRTQVGL